MSLLLVLSIFLLGMLSGAVSIISLTIFLGKRALDRKKAAQTNSAPPVKKTSIADRMKRVKEITNEQVDLASAAEGPQKNSLDGKYKNSLIRRMKQLDEEKNEILKSILLDGHDPELTTMDSSGVVTQMKLSEYLAYMGVSLTPKAKSAEEIKTERMGKFTVFRGGKDDGGNTTH